jgi:hypothetical protein
MPVAYLTPAIEDRAADILTLLAARWHCGHSFLAVPGPVIRLRRGRVEAMIPRDTASPARTMR